MEPGKKWKKEDIIQLLDSNPNAVMKGILAIYNLQTEDEKTDKESRHENKVGFGKVDAIILSEFARSILIRGGLSQTQLVIGRNKIKKYWKQLMKIANGQIIVQERSF